MTATKSSKTIGEILTFKRQALDISLETAEKELKIKKRYLEFLENDKFDAFDSQVHAKGFLKNYATFLGLNQDMLVALYRRDYENRNMKRQIKIVEDEESDEDEIKESSIQKFKNKIGLTNFIITKRKVVILCSVFVVLIFSLIILRTLQRTFDKPYLEILSPFEIKGEYKGRIAYESSEIVIKGKIERGNSIIINEAIVSVSPDLTFISKPIPTLGNENVIVIRSENSLGAQTVMEITLYKVENEIDGMDLIMTSREFSPDLTIKSDGVIRYEGSTEVNQIIEIHAERVLEILTTDLDNFDVFVNGQQYQLDSEVVIFENTGRSIQKR